MPILYLKISDEASEIIQSQENPAAFIEKAVKVAAVKVAAVTRDSIMEDIMALCKVWGVDHEKMFSASQKPDAVALRKKMYLALREKKYSYNKIGSVFNKNHATIMYAVKN